jgi:transmembrane sensor
MWFESKRHATARWTTMSREPRSSGPSEAALNEARRWVVRLHSGEVDRAEINRLSRWRAEDVAHRQAFAMASAQWELLRSAAQVFPVPRRSLADRWLSRRALLGGGAIAASSAAAAYVVAQSPLGLWPSLSELTADYRTDFGERRQIAVGTQVSVEMNTRTSMIVAADGPEIRRINLIAGEIAVTAGGGAVAPSPAVMIVAGEGTIHAEHASFDLRHDGAVSAVACLEGQVRVECRGEVAMLEAGQHVGFGASGLGPVGEADGRVVQAWRQGLLVFDEQPLSQVIAEINRYRRGRIILMNDEIGRLPLDATFQIDRIDEVVPKITHIFALKARTLPGGLVLLS